MGKVKPDTVISVSYRQQMSVDRITPQNQSLILLRQDGHWPIIGFQYDILLFVQSNLHSEIGKSADGFLAGFPQHFRIHCTVKTYLHSDRKWKLV